MELETKSFIFLLGVYLLILCTILIVIAVMIKVKGRKLLHNFESKDFEVSLLAPRIDGQSLNSENFTDIEGLTEGFPEAPPPVNI